jgi:hypothetical protein
LDKIFAVFLPSQRGTHFSPRNFVFCHCHPFEHGGINFQMEYHQKLGTESVGNKHTERMVVKIFALQDTDLQTWANVINSTLKTAHVLIEGLTDSQLRGSSATLILQVVQSKISHE